MIRVFYIPVVWNAIGRLRVILGRHAQAYTVQVPLTRGTVVVKVYEVTEFHIMKTIEGQAVGQYLFIRSDFKRDTQDWKRIMLHELKHVEQQCEHGWFGMWFLIKYVFQFVVYTVAYMGIISLALKRMPLEREAYATEAQLKSAARPTPPSA